MSTQTRTVLYTHTHARAWFSRSAEAVLPRNNTNREATLTCVHLNGTFLTRHSWFINYHYFLSFVIILLTYSTLHVFCFYFLFWTLRFLTWQELYDLWKLVRHFPFMFCSTLPSKIHRQQHPRAPSEIMWLHTFRNSSVCAYFFWNYLVFYRHKENQFSSVSVSFC